ncbi:MAG: bifunctional tetrahydrofolate synthase/dihydrofolate synthase [Arenimonas sp.]|jgi:dihydrofolate synthase/folylpolyglutamate synthase|uniref:bifunctional tetrahydrofolate synthase/dihydrofolate synthase n=1 Tax=Arenimonas sp. TaxID=1872635 RepID=UPI001B654E88|nr:bifunctional tetrahydrofolate synthase/dihydrofolate synthase [Arenimonas sp.]
MKCSLDQWLTYQLGTHPQAIAMGLERVRAVAERLQLLSLPCPVITVGGTNGKGSTVAYIEAIAQASGYRVGAFTSPHFLRYNERIRIEGIEVPDADLVAAFEAIETARAEVPLTYFEFGTLAALFLFARAGLDLAILEVGLGGRLDAVNLIDADVSVITTVDLDHQAYLGNDRESIGLEKAGIMRAARPCILGEKDPPSSVLRHAYESGVYCIRAYSDYLIDRFDSHWVWREPGFSLDLPYPQLQAPAQIQNAACAIAALRASSLNIADTAWAQGVAATTVTGRLQRWRTDPEVILDVAHNPQSVAQLVTWLQMDPKPTIAVFSALKDKDIAGMLAQLAPHIDFWHVAVLSQPADRAMSAQDWQQPLSTVLSAAAYRIHADVASAYATALSDHVGQRILVFGSFHTLEAVMRLPQPEVVGV